jgi:hypothetical protein
MGKRNSLIELPIVWLGFLPLAMCRPATAADAPAAIHWKQTVFSIPYQINRPATADDAPLEVRLLVSEDGGANWKTLQSAQPQLRGFVYNAEKDGDYWFAVQTVDRFGRLHPPSDIRPELHVVVDTAPPRVELDKEMASSGEILLKCRLADPHLQSGSLTVSVRNKDGEFQPLDVPDTRMEPGAPIEVAIPYSPPVGTRILQARAEISDLAGNRSITQIEIDLLTAQHHAVAADNATDPAGSPPIQNAIARSPAMQSSSAGWNPVDASAYPKTPFTAAPDPKDMLLQPPQLAGPAGLPSRSPTAQPWPVDQVAVAPPSPQSDEARSAPSSSVAANGELAETEPLPPPKASATPAWAARQTSSSQSGSPHTGNTASLPGPATQTGAAGASDPQAVVTAATPTPEVIPAGESLLPEDGPSAGRSTDYPSTRAPLVNVGWPGSSGAPASQQEATSVGDDSATAWQMVNSRTIALDYEVASVGPWGVSEVELWGTRDGGQTWRKYASDDDNRSPVTATVEGEGEYGFRVVVHSAGGFAATPPQAGDVPEARVRIDLVPPEATIESVQQGTGNTADQIMIRWSASDAQLATNPVTLYYSAQAAGPWSIIAAGLQHTGSYGWRAERHLPEQVYVRLEVRDAAGNTNTFQTAQPVSIHRPRPQARIRDVRPLGSSAVRPSANAQR